VWKNGIHDEIEKLALLDIKGIQALDFFFSYYNEYVFNTCNKRNCLASYKVSSKIGTRKTRSTKLEKVLALAAIFMFFHCFCIYSFGHNLVQK